MPSRARILIALGCLVALAAIVLGVETLRRPGAEPELAPGSIPVYFDGRLLGGVTPDDLTELEEVSFVDAEEGKTQQGWMLRDVLLLRLKRQPGPDAAVRVSSSSREKAVELSWGEVQDPANWVVLALSGRSTLKLVSVLERLDARDEWVQDVDRIDVVTGE